MKKKLNIFLIILVCLSLLPFSAFAVTYGKVGESTNFNGDVGVPTGKGFYVNGVQVTSAILSDVASIAMLDEDETLTGHWTFADYFLIQRASDAPSTSPLFYTERARDGDPTSDVSSGDELGRFYYSGYHTSGYHVGAQISVVVDGTPGDWDMPGRLEFSTTPDGSDSPDLRMAIDQAGNIKMGDGAWTNYVNIDSSGNLTPVGTAIIDLNQSYILVDDTLGTDHDYSGLVDSDTVGESVVFGDLLYFDWTDVEWKKAKADAVGTTPCQRIALESKANGEVCLMLVQGWIRDDSAFDFGASRIFLNDDTAGTCDDTAPAESGDQIQVVGIGTSADTMYFNPSVDVGEI